MQETASQTNTFLSRIFGDGLNALEGYLTLGFIPVDLSTGKRGKMVPEAFEWPKERKKALAWIDEKSRKGEVFYCPALRADRGRKKGNAVEAGLQWLWADVDMEKVPADRIEGVKRAISLLSTLTVRSGSGDNCHVYVKIEEGLDKEQHEYLNTLLRDLLCADNKQADNSLLRVAGTYNYKALVDGKPRNAVTYAENKKGGGRRGKSLRESVVTGWLEKHWDKREDSAGEDRDSLKKRLARNGGGYEDRGREGVDWTRVDEGKVRRICRGSIKALVGITTQQVLDGDHLGKRYIAVKNVAEKLYGRREIDGDRNLVHTLMDDFAPGRDKEKSERSYSLHRDLECILDGVEAGLAAHEVWGVEARDGGAAAGDKKKGSESDSDGAVEDEEGGDGDRDPWNPDAEWVERKEANKYWSYKTSEAARRKLRGEEAAMTMPSLDDDGETAVYETLADTIRKGIPEQQFMVDGLCGVGHNVTITAQYKTGKTTFAMNLARSLVQDNRSERVVNEDGSDGVSYTGKFLGGVKLLKGDGPEGRIGGESSGSGGSGKQGWNVAVWSCEMDRNNLARDLVRMGFSEQEARRLGVFHLRGSRVDIMSEEGMEWAVRSLCMAGVKNNVNIDSENVDGGGEGDSQGSGEGQVPGYGSTRVWIIDSLARLCAMSGVEENDNSGVMQLLKRVDEIKKKAGVSESFILVHTGRAEQEAGKERARGATAVDDWADVRWLLTKDDMGHRYLRADGRGVSMEETVLDFDKERLLLSLGSGDRVVNEEKEILTLISSAVQEYPGISLKKLKVVIRKGVKQGFRDDKLYEAIDEAIELKLIKKRRGARNSNAYYPVGVSVEQARSSNGPARSVRTQKRAGSRRVRHDENTGFDPEAYHAEMSDRPHRTQRRARPRMLDVWKDA